jgi:class 3 adenylate cyclase/tetratricopeptide (TPR) repeat protein
MTGSTRTVSVLFTDLVGSTDLASRLGPARWDPLLRRHLEDLDDALQRVGGTMVKSAGDGIMAMLSSASAAVACAVAMQQGVELRNRRSDTPLAMRVGIAVGDAEEVDGDWYGRPPVEAKRLCDLAAGGQVLVTEAVRLLVQSADGPTLEPVGPLALKGFPEPVATSSVVWEPLPADAGRPPLPPLVRSLPTDVFVGRAEEQERLAAAWGRALEGQRGLALVSGEPGIGKTTLAGTLAIAAHRHGAVVLYGRSERDVGLPYEPWRQALGQLVECAPAHVLHAHARRHGGALAALAPAFRERAEDPPAHAASDPETERYLLFAATLAILEDVAGEAPVLLLLDDLHCAGRPTIALLQHLQLAAGAMRLLVVGTYRDSEQSQALKELLEALQRQPGIERIALDGLSETEVGVLLETTAGGALTGSPDSVAQELHGWTKGNPFFLAETVRHVGEMGRRLDTSRGLDGLDLPKSVVEVIRGRVARLGDDAADLLSSAAVIGREFDLDVLTEIAATRTKQAPALDDALDVLDGATKAALVEEHPEREGRYAFVHPLVVRALEEELTRGRRALMHQRVAEVLEARLADDPRSSVGDVAYHWAKALGTRGPEAHGTPAHAKAVEFAVRAGRTALAQLAPDEALRWFEDGSSLLGDAPGQDEVRRELLIGLGEAQVHAGRPEFRETLLEAAEMSLAADDRDRLIDAALLNNRGMFSSSGHVDEERLAILEAALDQAPSDDPRRARLLALLAAELLWSDDDERRRALSDEAVELGRSHGDPAALAYALIMRVTAVWTAENLAERLDMTDEALRLANGVGDPHQRFWALVWRATTLTQAARLEEADLRLADLYEIVGRVQDPRLRFVAAAQQACRAQLAGRIDDAERLAEAALALGQDAGEPDAVTLFAAQLIPIRWHQGRLAEEAGLADFIVVSAPQVALFRALAALAAYEAGDHAEPQRLLAAATERAFDLPRDPVRLGSWCIWAELATRLGDRRAAAILLTRLEGLRDCVVSEALGTFGVVSRCVGSLAGTLGRSDEADAHFRHALAAHERMGAASLAARTRVEWGAMLAGAGRVTEAREQLSSGAQAAAGLALPGLERRARETLLALRSDGSEPAASGPAIGGTVVS